ncbi:hypothetical protein G9A89_003057 [Geosiphon pyriformis]|nr:hypothetical protein G9A89_003057 [Geosiphon pyriformis]
MCRLWKEPTTIKYYCRPYIIEKFGKPKRQGKWNSTPCLVCGEILLDKGFWNDVSGKEETCDKMCQYTILINNWIQKETPIKAAWRQALSRLDGYLLLLEVFGLFS